MPRLDARTYLLLAAAASAAMLASAHAFEHIGGLAPCLLCLRQREVYWIALPVAVAGLVLLARRPEPAMPRVLPLLLGLVFLVGFGIAGFHAGVEQKWWPGPTLCVVGGGVDAAALDALAGGAAQRVVSCAEIPWSLFGLSMAGWNALISLGLAGLGVWTSLAAPRRSLAAAHA